MAATSALIRATRQRSAIFPYSMRRDPYPGSLEMRAWGLRQLSILNDFSKQVKGEANSNQEFQLSVKELNEKFGAMKEGLKVRTKKTTDKLYKNFDDTWAEVEATKIKVSVNVKEKIAATKDEVFGRAKEQSSESSSTTNSSNAKPGENRQNSGPTETFSQQTETFFSRFTTTISSVSPKISLAFEKLKEAKLSGFAREGYNIVKDELTSSSSKRTSHHASRADFSGARSTRTDVVIAPSKQSPLGERWEGFKNKMKGHPIFKHASQLSQPVVTKGQEFAEDVREQWETSDNPVVHKIQDLNDSVFGETATALSFKEIRRRDPSFYLPDFLVEVQEMIRPVLTACLKCDLETLKKHCCSQVLERCKGERMAYESQGMFFHNKILHISDVHVCECKLIDSSPFIFVQFTTQQIHCVRNRDGLVTSGGKDTIHTVHHLWVMQLIDIEDLGEESYYPQWKLREMQQQGLQALI